MDTLNYSKSWLNHYKCHWVLLISSLSHSRINKCGKKWGEEKNIFHLSEAEREREATRRWRWRWEGRGKGRGSMQSESWNKERILIFGLHKKGEGKKFNWRVKRHKRNSLWRQSALSKSLHFSWHLTPHSVHRTPCLAKPHKSPSHSKQNVGLVAVHSWKLWGVTHEIG